MYEWRDTFSLLAELAIAVVGFSGIIGAFYANTRLSKASKAYLDIYYLLSYSILMLFGCMIPFLVFDWATNETTAWRVCSSIVLAIGLFVGIVFRKENKALMDSDRLLFPSMLIGDVAMGLLHVANVTGLFFEPNGRVYAVGLYWCFIGSMVGFTKVVSHAWSRGAQTPDSE